jgi:single-strand DNA-binding protein
MSKGGVNKVILIGNLGKDPELRSTPGGQSVCNFSLATSEQWTDKAGEKHERTEWNRVVFWGKPAEIIKQYAQKGQRLYVEGKLQTRSWDDKDGSKKYSTEIVGSDFMLLSGKGQGQAEQPAQMQPEDEMPF